MPQGAETNMTDGMADGPIHPRGQRNTSRQRARGMKAKTSGRNPEEGAQHMVSSTADDRIEQLERKIAELEKQVESTSAAGAQPSPHPADGDASKDINYYCICAAAAGAVGVPVIDVAAVTAVQVRLVKRLASLDEKDFDDESGKALASALTGAVGPVLLGQTGARMAARWIPVVGPAVALVTVPALNYASTRVVGHYFRDYFKSGGKAKPDFAKLARDVQATYRTKPAPAAAVA
jgi:uncharacterized protein (DUF697 family)